MFEIGLANITMFFVIVGISLIFVVTWIIKSESRISVCGEEIGKLKSDLDSSERERFVLSEKVANMKSAGAESDFDPEGLREENKELKKELVEAKSSLEEVYKALS